MIKKLDEATTQELCAHQVITSLPDCIKELVDNSIDAGATLIEVHLDQYGTTSIEVIDNGTGVSAQQLVKIGQKGTSSKNKEDFQVNTLGFRGQALNSIARVSSSMLIYSNTGEDISTANIYDAKARKIVQNTRNLTKGTKVKIQNLFENMPVRRIQLIKRQKQFLKAIFELMKEYAVAYYELALVLVNRRVGKSEQLLRTSVVKSTKKTSWKIRIEEVLGKKISQKLVFVEGKFIEGFLLDKIQSGSSYENQIIRNNLVHVFINRRPIEKNPLLIEALESYYKRYNNSTKYIAILNIKLELEQYDVNLTSNKRQVLIRKKTESLIADQLKDLINKNVVQTVPSLPDKMAVKEASKSVGKQINKGTVSQTKSAFNVSKVQQQLLPSTQKQFQQGFKTSNSLIDKLNSKMGSRKSELSRNHKNSLGSQEKGYKATESKPKPQTKFKITPYVPKKEPSLDAFQNQFRNEQTQQITQVKHEKEVIHHRYTRIVISKPIEEISQSQCQHNSVEPVKSLADSQDRVQLKCKNIEIVVQKDQRVREVHIQQQPISTSVQKSDFGKFESLGQFNNAFLPCRFEGKIYLIDQHAASEKTKFQTLIQQKPRFTQTRQECQINPVFADQAQVRRQQLQAYGFRFLINKPRTLIQFERFPVYLDKQVGRQHFLDLIENKIAFEQLPLVQNTAATKACRSAIMIGDVLSQKQSTQIVHNLSNLKSPWNCPHGRPTLIALGSIQDYTKRIETFQNFDF